MLEVRKHQPQFMGGVAFHDLHDISCGIRRKDANEEVDMVLHHRKQYDVPTLLLAFGADQAFALSGDRIYKHRLSALRTENEVVDQQVYAMLVSLIFHVDVVPQNCGAVNTFEKKTVTFLLALQPES